MTRPKYHDCHIRIPAPHMDRLRELGYLGRDDNTGLNRVINMALSHYINYEWQIRMWEIKRKRRREDWEPNRGRRPGS